MHDVVIVGCGPAGSTAANLLASAGHDVLVLEQAHFPRFHIGESLLPIDLPVFARLGLGGFEPTFQFKQGAEFWDEATGDFAFYSFADGLPGTPTHAWQVDRAEFDNMLAQTAAARGAKISFGTKVVDLDIGRDEVRVRSSAGEHRARFVVDATGQDAWLARRERSLQPIHGLGRAAVFRHFSDLAPNVAAELAREGNIKILMVEDGWLWAIPLVGGRLSVGLVRWRGKLDVAAYDAALENSVLLQRILAGATHGPTQTLANWSYHNAQPSGARWACIGDAAAFLDPVFSSGVSLAILGAEQLSDRLSAALARREEADPALMVPCSQHMARAYQTFEQLIRRFYHSRMVHHIFFAPEPDPELRRGLISVLAGDVWRHDNAFQRLLDQSRQSTDKVRR